MKGKIHVDSSAQLVQHIGVVMANYAMSNFGSLWIQELVEEEEIFMCRVPGAENIADILTKHVGASLLDKHAANMSIFFPSGTVESGLHL